MIVIITQLGIYFELSLGNITDKQTKQMNDGKKRGFIFLMRSKK
jgi:hypothetical protein